MNSTPETNLPTQTPVTPVKPPRYGIAIEDASAWILRIGVGTSVGVMLIGIVMSFIHHNVAIERMDSATFDLNFHAIWNGLRTMRGKAIIEVGIFLLVLTPIVRVFTSMVLFAVEDRDWLYAIITFLVLALTLAGFILLK